jgi:Uncharacterized protein conserved in bacteria (DUF2125)
MRYSSRFFLYAPLAGLLLLAAIAMAHWWFVASALAKRLDAVNGHGIMPGVRIGFSHKTLGGFPFRLDLLLKNLRVEVAEVDGPIVWTSEDFAMHELTYGRAQAIFEAAGRQTLSWTDPHGAVHRFAFLPGTFRASAILQDGRLVRFDSEIIDLDGDAFRARNAQLHMRAPKVGIDVFLSLAEAHVQGGYAAALGPDISNLVVNGTLDLSDKLQALLRGAQAPQAALEDWRQSGGAMAVNDFALTKGETTAHFHGRLALDTRHDAVGALVSAGPGDGTGRVLNFAGTRIVFGSGLARP